MCFGCATQKEKNVSCCVSNAGRNCGGSTSNARQGPARVCASIGGAAANESLTLAGPRRPGQAWERCQVKNYVRSRQHASEGVRMPVCLAQCLAHMESRCAARPTACSTQYPRQAAAVAAPIVRHLGPSQPPWQGLMPHQRVARGGPSAAPPPAASGAWAAGSPLQRERGWLLQRQPAQGPPAWPGFHHSPWPVRSSPAPAAHLWRCGA